MRIIEATLIVPITILIMTALIGVMMSFYTDFVEQTEEHTRERAELYKISETVYIRAADRLTYVETEN